MAQGRSKSKKSHRTGAPKARIINGIPYTHFECPDGDAADKRGAAKWAWTKLEYLADAFCKMYCSRIICDVYREAQKQLGIEKNPIDEKAWRSVQESFHDALSAMPELKKETEGCPACSVVIALSYFPTLLIYHKHHSNKQWLMERDGFCPQLIRDSRAPCFAFAIGEGISVTMNAAVKERALLEFDPAKFPPIPPHWYDEAKKALTNGQSVVRAIDNILNSKKMLGGRDETQQAVEEAIEVDFFQKEEDGWYWVVNGVERERTADKTSRKIYLISRLLYDHIGMEHPIPHKTFYREIGWTEEEYFGDKSKRGRMQKHLHILRKNLGLEIEFNEDGVKLPANVVKAKKRPS